MSQRNLTYLNNHRIVYRRLPINDIPDQVNEVYAYYMKGYGKKNQEVFK